MSRNLKRKERAKNEIQMAVVLRDFGFQVRVDAGQRQQQFSCRLHGDGRDNSPSARVYPRNNTWYCWGCGLTRDTISTVRAIQGLGFMEAIDFLEKEYGLPPIPFDDDDSIPRPKTVLARDEITTILSKAVSFEEVRVAMTSVLDGITRERDLPMELLLPFWEGLDRLAHMVTETQIEDHVAAAAVAGLHDRVLRIHKDQQSGETLE